MDGNTSLIGYASVADTSLGRIYSFIQKVVNLSDGLSVVIWPDALTLLFRLALFWVLQ